ncbi:hypothetical protein Moror_13777 [Moniliophthora roreri MCA 2997]|uniref:GmrSD restriction endonucleases N-terminal domain-containing protein n=1 Tax=Moniliophthora roreri (strain MCA 2997) TaxID=1381753 RepID=V2WU17_MONRO|nr:hypothetical protein Moror_13777 [Moniliophthora roreri MCA 2997]
MPPLCEDDMDSDLTEIEDSEEEEEDQPRAEELPPLPAPVKIKKPQSQQAISLKTTKSRSTRSSIRALKTEPTPPPGPALQPAVQRAYAPSWLYDQMKKGKINLDPEYQRDVVWNDSKQSALIDSLMNNFPIPQVIFSVTEHPTTGELTRTCIDGKQRLTSIRRFWDGELCHKDPLTAQKSWYTTSGVKGRKVLPAHLKDRFESSVINCLEYRGITDDHEREIFSRVQNGVALTVAERLQAINGPYPNLIRKVRDKVNQSFNGNVNWGKDRGRDFQVVAQALYLIESSISSAKIPSQPTHGEIEKWLINNAKKAGVHPSFLKKTCEVITILCALVLDPKLGKPFVSSHKFSAMEFMMTAYMIFLHAKDLSMERLSIGVQCLRETAQGKSKGEVRFNSTIYKHLAKYVRQNVKSAIHTRSGNAEQQSATDYWAKEEKYLVDRIMNSVEVKKIEAMDDDATDSDVPLIRKRKSNARDSGDEEMSKRAKTKRKLNPEPQAGPSRTIAVKQEKKSVREKKPIKEDIFMTASVSSNFLKTMKISKASSASAKATSKTPASATSSSAAAPRTAKKPTLSSVNTEVPAGASSLQAASRNARPTKLPDAPMTILASADSEILPDRTAVSRRRSSNRSFPCTPELRHAQSESALQPSTPQLSHPNISVAPSSSSLRQSPASTSRTALENSRGDSHSSMGSRGSHSQRLSPGLAQSPNTPASAVSEQSFSMRARSAELQPSDRLASLRTARSQALRGSNSGDDRVPPSESRDPRQRMPGMQQGTSILAQESVSATRSTAPTSPTSEPPTIAAVAAPASQHGQRSTLSHNPFAPGSTNRAPPTAPRSHRYRSGNYSQPQLLPIATHGVVMLTDSIDIAVATLKEDGEICSSSSPSASSIAEDGELLAPIAAPHSLHSLMLDIPDAATRLPMPPSARRPS